MLNNIKIYIPDYDEVSLEEALTILTKDFFDNGKSCTQTEIDLVKALKQNEKYINDLWDSITDMLNQKQIDILERLHPNPFL